MVAEQSEVVVGYLLAHALPTLFAGGPILEIVELVVDPEKRGEGVGRALVEHALTEAWSNGCVEVVAPTRRAAAFYEHLGFEPTATYFKRKRP
ncbi:GCN5-like N-acetyltransferase [Fimbriimonas ginsengisoli Gsoil 348]|uniref:GCN5-like N-acetyltransferase n=1 Tax=Fimbriimonas ginsengisoli Gsoil 348 TaxID=661478 RepID=A0A068NT14_FIMGI|nr:GCN5-like N-acetyltransferase [Fimbriimonas ginsengisoli Gsoil 348]